MFKTVDLGMFIEEVEKCELYEFSPVALEIIFNYLEDFEDDNRELYPADICISYREYTNMEDFYNDYPVDNPPCEGVIFSSETCIIVKIN